MPALGAVESLQCNHQLIFHRSIDPFLAHTGWSLSLSSQAWGIEPVCRLFLFSS